MANELEQQGKEINKQLLTTKRERKENIDQLIRKEFEQQRKLQKQRFQDPLETKLDYYDMSLPDLVSTQNITKEKQPPKQIEKYSENELDMINSELTVSSNEETEDKQNAAIISAERS